jgi:hypothetical protein
MEQRSRVKEAAEIKVPQLPNANQFRSWKHTVYQNINAAVGRTDDEPLKWIRECEKIDAEPDAFKTCAKRFATLDRKLAAALSNTITGELGRLLIQQSDDAMNEGRSVRGRELLHTIIKYYSTGRTAELMFCLNDLHKVQAKGGNLEGFQNTWIMVLKALPKMPDLEMIEYLYFQQVKGMRVLSEDVAHYNRQEIGHIDKSYDFLYRSVERHLRLTRQERTRNALSRGLIGNAIEPLKSPATPGKPKAKAKANGEARGRSPVKKDGPKTP